MASGRMTLRLGVAALVSGAAAGTLLPLAICLAGLFAGSAASWWGFAMLITWLQVGFVAGLVVASLPAFFAGASMWALGASFDSARRPSAWAVAGAAVGGAGWVLLGLVIGGLDSGDGLDAFESAILAATLAAGAGAALAFLGAMRLMGRWFGLEELPEA